ncbi:MAG: undecaprenyl-diphosphatase UppP [Pirellulales bacterium]|nr:undecaprenyl-diphosphatase UppP [Pirellulales bacterium]
MSLLEAIILGIIQGLTEFLPISSTAHVKIAMEFLGLSDETGAAFTAVIQIGTLAAAIAYFRADILRIVRAVCEAIWQRQPLGTYDARLGWMIAAGTIPIVVCGLIFSRHIESTLRSFYVISAALIVVALLMEVAEEFMVQRLMAHVPPKELDNVTWHDSLWIGVAQAFALIPGVSRSGSTITAGLFRNFSRPTAAKFSFLLSLPAIFGAALKELIEHREALLGTSHHAVALIVATIVSGIVGYLSIAFLLKYLKTRTTRAFVVYRIALAAMLLVLLLTGVLPRHIAAN